MAVSVAWVALHSFACVQSRILLPQWPSCLMSLIVLRHGIVDTVRTNLWNLTTCCVLSIQPSLSPACSPSSAWSTILPGKSVTVGCRSPQGRKIPPVVGPEHARIGRILTGAVVGVALLGRGHPTVTIMMIISLAILPEIYRDKSQHWRNAHTLLNSIALLLCIGQGITGVRDLLEIPLSGQEPFIYQCDFVQKICHVPLASQIENPEISASAPNQIRSR